MRAPPHTLSSCALVVLASVVLPAGCGGSNRALEQIVDIYEVDQTRARSRASSIVFVPGVMGSELHDGEDGHAVWGTFWEGGAWDESLVDIALPFAIDTPVSELRDSVVPGDEMLVVNLAVAGRSIHARGYPGLFEGLVQELTDEGAHHAPGAIDIEDVLSGRNPIVGFGYDWRRDIPSEAKRLHDVILEASAERNARTGNPRVDLIGHSMGTQLVRWYLRYGTAPLPEDGSLPELTWAGVRYVERAILVGAPNRGEAQVLEVLLEGAQEHRMIPVYPPAVVATFPSAFEMLPRPEDRRVVWADNGDPVDLYDVRIWERLGWGPFAPDQDAALATLMPDAGSREERLRRLHIHMSACLEHAERFHAALDRPATFPHEVQVHTFAGDAHATPTSLRVDRVTGAFEWESHSPGDGTVTRTSALGQSHHDPEQTPTIRPHSVHFIRAEHLPLVADRAFLDHALYLLLESPDPPAPKDPDAR